MTFIGLHVVQLRKFREVDAENLKIDVDLIAVSWKVKVFHSIDGFLDH